MAGYSLALHSLRACARHLTSPSAHAQSFRACARHLTASSAHAQSLRACAQHVSRPTAHAPTRSMADCCPRGYPCKEIKPIPRSDLGVKVALCGAASDMGKFLAMQLKLSPLLKQINMFDLEDTFGNACDLNHISTRCKVKSFHGPRQLKLALMDVDIVLILGGKAWSAGVSSEDLFNLNVGSVRCLAEATAHFCPDAIIGVITRPINAFVPLVNEVYKRAHRYNPDRVIGMVTHEVMKANSIVANTHYLDASSVHVPVIGGASNVSVVPLLSLAKPYNDFSREVTLKTLSLIRHSEDDMGKGSLAISGAYAAARFCLTMVRGMCEQPDAVMSAFIRSNVLPHCKYFANQVQLGPGGVMKNFGIPKISGDERSLLEQAVPYIHADMELSDQYMLEDDRAFAQTS